MVKSINRVILHPRVRRKRARASAHSTSPGNDFPLFINNSSGVSTLDIPRYRRRLIRHHRRRLIRHRRLFSHHRRRLIRHHRRRHLRPP
jgi:hypothetical protein